MSLFVEAKEHARLKFQERYGQLPTWGRHHFVQLADLLKHPHITVDEFKRRWNNFLGSTKHSICCLGGSLAWFCANSDSFIEGPLHDQRGSHGQARTGKTNGSGAADPLARFRGVERKASEFADRTASEFAASRLLLLLDKRFQTGKHTLFTSNLDLDRFTGWVGDDRVSSRIRGMCGAKGIIQLQGRDLRCDPVEAEQVEA